MTFLCQAVFCQILPYFLGKNVVFLDNFPPFVTKMLFCEGSLPVPNHQQLRLVVQADNNFVAECPLVLIHKTLAPIR